MSKALEPKSFELDGARGRLAGESIGEGTDIVLLHGLTATRHYTVMGSKALPRGGYRLTTYDARGHGRSSAARDPGAYEYRNLADDLGRVLDHLACDRAVIGGASMGAATSLAFALREPERVAALIQVTPAHDGRPADRETLAEWDALADGLERGGIDGFLAVYEPSTPERWRETVLTVVRQRLERHRDLNAVAQALRVVPRSAAFDGLEALERLTLPTLVVASRDEADPQHPLRVGREYAERIAGARLVTEEPGKSPLAWQGARLSQTIATFLESVEPA
ncbi:MAG: hypothetical protein NVSMB25_24010 [Thermoleophilaceae bacterium]